MIASRVNAADTVAAAVKTGVLDAYKAMCELCEPGIEYRFKWSDSDGQIIHRFSRTTGYEAWLVATPVHSDGSYRRDRDQIIAPIALDLEGHTVSDLLRELLDLIIGDQQAGA